MKGRTSGKNMGSNLHLLQGFPTRVPRADLHRSSLPCNTSPGTATVSFGSAAVPSRRCARHRWPPSRWWKPGLLAMPWSHGNWWIFSGLVGGVENFDKNQKLMFYDVFVDIGKLKAMAAMSFCWVVEWWKERNKFSWKEQLTYIISDLKCMRKADHNCDKKKPSSCATDNLTTWNGILCLECQKRNDLDVARLLFLESASTIWNHVISCESLVQIWVKWWESLRWIEWMIWLQSEHGRGSMEVHSKNLTVQSVVQGVDVTYKYIEGHEIKPWLSLLTRPSIFFYGYCFFGDRSEFLLHLRPYFAECQPAYVGWQPQCEWKLVLAAPQAPDRVISRNVPRKLKLPWRPLMQKPGRNSCVA